jgi:tripartite ATP-independent transporter DctP family solute receptor
MKDAKMFLLSQFMMASITVVSLNVSAMPWQGWNIHSSGYPNTIAMDRFSALLEDKSGGLITLQMLHGGALGSQPEAIEQVRRGDLVIGNFSLGVIGPIVPEANILSLPFLFKSIGHMHRVMDGPVGDVIRSSMAKQGLVVLAWFDEGARSFYNSKHPINSPDDLKGMKIRIMSNPIYADMIRLLGAIPYLIPYTAIEQSLENGIVDGAENGWPQYDSTGHYKVAPYYSVSQHLIVPECLCINAEVFNKLTLSQKILVKEAAQEAARLQRVLWDRHVTTSKDKLQKAGVKINEIKDKGAFQLAMYPLYIKFQAENPEMKALIEQIIVTK